VKLQELQDEFSVLVRKYRDAQGSTTDAGDEVFDAISDAMADNSGGQHYAFWDGFARRCK